MKNGNAKDAKEVKRASCFCWYITVCINDEKKLFFQRKVRAAVNTQRNVEWNATFTRKLSKFRE